MVAVVRILSRETRTAVISVWPHILPKAHQVFSSARLQARREPDPDARHNDACIVFSVVRRVWKTYKHGIKKGEMKAENNKRSQQPPRDAYCSAARCFLLTSRSSAMVSLVPLPLGSEIHGLVPSPITKMFVILTYGASIRCFKRANDIKN